MTHAQLLRLGYGPKAIQHRVATGRLHPRWRGVYAVGRPELSRHGVLMAAVLACGPDAALSHESAAELWELLPQSAGPIHVRARTDRRHPGIRVHRRRSPKAAELAERHGIPVTSPACTLVDVAPRLSRDELEAAVNEADKRGLAKPDELRAAVEALGRRPGVAVLRALLDRRTFRLTDSTLERLFIPIAIRAGLPRPATRRRLNGFRVDFYWAELGLVVETDGLRYHRTPAQQARDRLRDQAHSAAGLVPLRFTHEQVRYDPGHVESTLAAVAARLRSRPG